MAIERYNEINGIKNVQIGDYDMIENLFATYVEPGLTGETEGMLNLFSRIINTYCIDPRKPFDGWDSTGTGGDTYQVKYDANDLEGYLGDKIQTVPFSGVTLTVNGTSNKVINIALDIQESTSTSTISLLQDSKTLKKLTQGTGITLTNTSSEINIAIDESFLEQITYGIKYSWTNESEMVAQTGMTEGDLGVRNDLGEVWRYDTIWSYFFSLGSSTTLNTMVDDVLNESYSGTRTTQQGVNIENVSEISNIYNLILGTSPAYGDLIGDPLPQAVASTETVATWSTVNQSSNTDVWEFNDTLNEILIKKAGFYTFNSQVSLTNSSNQDRFLIFSTRDKNNPTTYFYTRTIPISRDGETSQSSIQFEVPDDNTTIEILAHGETSTGNGSNNLTFTEWNTSLTLNFVLLPEFDLATDNIDVSSPTLESINGAGGATKQSGINAENKGAIEDLQDDVGKVSISTGDTSNLYLEDKLIAGDNITLAKTNNQGGEESIVINSTAVNPETTDLDYAKLNKDPDSITETTTTDEFYTNLLINGEVDVSDATRINITSNGVISNPSLGSDTVKVLINYSFNIRAYKDQTTYGEQFPCYVKFGDGANTYVGNEFYGIKATAVNLQDSESWTTVSGSSVVDLVGGGEDWYWQVRSSLTAGGTIQVRDSSISVTEIGTSVTTGGTGVDENVKASDTDTTAGKLIDKLAEGSNVTLSIQNEGGDEKILITSSGEVSTIVKQGVNYYNLGSDICNNTNGTGQEIGNISSVYNNGTGWLMKSANGNVLTDIPTVANVTYADGLSPAIPILDNTKAIQMKLRTGNCRVFDTNRNDKTGIAYVEINIFELDSQSIISTNHSLVQTVQLMDSFGANNASVVGKGQTSNNYVTFELTNLNGIFTLDSAKQYGFTISGTNDQNAPKSVEKIMLMDTALLTVVYEGEVL